MEDQLTQDVETCEKFVEILTKKLEEVHSLFQEMLNHPDNFEEGVDMALQHFAKSLPIQQAVNIFWPLLGSDDQMSEKDKMNAVQIAEILGPDFVSKFRRFGKFMAVVQEA